MAARWTERKLYLYSLHAHRGPKAISNYRAMFASLAELRVSQRAITTTTQLTAIRRLSIGDDYVRITAYEGPPGVAPLIFDLRTAEERIEELGAREVMATRTHAIINLRTRDAVVEYNHRGAKARDIADVLEEAARKHLGWRNVVIEFSPVASPDFAKAIDEFEAIKTATLNIIRPNLNWNKERNHAAALAEESDGQRVEVSVFAGRSASLSRSKGIVALIKGLGKEPKSSLKNASVSGRRKGEKSDTTISLERHLEHRNVRVRVGSGGHPTTQSVDQRILEFLKVRTKASRKRGSGPND